MAGMISKTELGKLVTGAASAVSKRSPVDWQQRILVQCTGGRLLFAGSCNDGTAWLSTECDCGEFRIAVKAADLQQLVSACRSESLRIFLQGNKLHFAGECGELSLAYCETAPAMVAGWPSLPSVPERSSVEVPASELAHALVCASQGMGDFEDNLFSLDSVLLRTDDDNGVLVVESTDGRKLVRVPVKASVHQSLAVQVAQTSFRLMLQLVNRIDSGDTVCVGCSGNDVVIWNDSAAVFLRQPAKRLPNLDMAWAIAAGQPAVSFELPSSALAAALREATIGYEPDTTRSVIVAANYKGVVIASKAEHVNQLESVFDIPLPGTPELVALFDWQFMLSLLRCTSSAVVKIIALSQGELSGYCAAIAGERDYRALLVGVNVTEADRKRGLEILKARR